MTSACTRAAGGGTGAPGGGTRAARAALAAFGAALLIAGSGARSRASAPAVDPAASSGSYAPVEPGRAIEFPADTGSHPEFRTEWWYVTGWLTTHAGAPLGFQVTFFRTKPAIDARNPSSFAPRQLLIAHCALSDPRHGRLWQDQRIRRAGLGLAEADTGHTDVWIDRWSLKGAGEVYTASIDAQDFALHLSFTNTQKPLLNGDAGVSRKGPAPQSASYYYSLPHMRVAGSIAREGHRDTVSGEAWFDHEWSSEYLDGQAVGWDWVGLNLKDGAALMAFRIRGPQGESWWAGGTFRAADGKAQILAPDAVAFTPIRDWRSPRTGTTYPVQWRVRAGSQVLDLEPLMDDQENDTRLSTGAIYWEGAVRAYEEQRLVGQGYLELTGYGERLRLR